jgi:phage/plasmid-like protein (TIGR03299 family)
MSVFTTKEAESVKTYNEALERFSLNYEVGLRPLLALWGNEAATTKEFINQKAVVRLDTGLPLGVVSNKYKVVQNSDPTIASLMDIVVSQLGGKFVRGGHFSEGTKVFMQIELPEPLRVKGTDDIIKKYLLFSNSHDGSTSVKLGNVNTRVVCLNTFYRAGAELSDDFTVRHTVNAYNRLEVIKEAVLNTLNYHKELQVKIDWLADQKFTDLQLDLSMRKMFGVGQDVLVEDISSRTRNTMEDIRDLFENGQGNAQWRGTKWAAFNAMSEWSTHKKTVRGDEESPNNRMESVLFGSAANFTKKAFEVLENA